VQRRRLGLRHHQCALRHLRLPSFRREHLLTHRRHRRRRDWRHFLFAEKSAPAQFFVCSRVNRLARLNRIGSLSPDLRMVRLRDAARCAAICCLLFD
jgi:hypothetical protein